MILAVEPNTVYIVGSAERYSVKMLVGTLEGAIDVSGVGLWLWMMVTVGLEVVPFDGGEKEGGFDMERLSDAFVVVGTSNPDKFMVVERSDSIEFVVVG